MIFFHYGDFDYKNINYYKGFTYRFPEKKMTKHDLDNFSQYLCENFLEKDDVHVVSTVRNVLDYCINYCKNNNLKMSNIRTIMNDENNGLGTPISDNGDFNIFLKMMNKIY